MAEQHDPINIYYFPQLILLYCRMWLSKMQLRRA